MVKKRPFDVGIIYGDVHDPYCDEPVWGMFLEAVKIIKPDFIIENGDGFNSDPFASFVRYPDVKLRAHEDREKFIERRSGLTKIAGRKCIKRYIPGTHEAWIPKALRENPQWDTEDNQWYNLLKLPQLSWDHVDFIGNKQPGLWVGKLFVTHGTFHNKHSGYSARAALDRYGCNMLINHCHRLGNHWKTTVSTTHAAFENGCLCNPDASREYQKNNFDNWQQGFSVVQVDHSTGWFRVSQIPILRVPGTGKKRMMLHETVLECNA